jgi:hypothetical protein
MDNADLDQLQRAYKQAVDAWVDAIRAEEAHATADHSMIAMESWDQAGFEELDAQARAKKARDQYKAGLRRLNYGI